MSRRTATLIVAAVLASWGASSGSAQLVFDVRMNTESLVGNPAGPFWLDFQLTDGSGTGDANNVAVLSDFQFGGGVPSGGSTLVGGATGDLTSTVTLTDSAFLTEFVQGFIPGNTLSFEVSLTANADSGGTPDEFSFAILDGSSNEIP